MNRRELLKAAAILPLSQTALSHAAFAQSPYPSRNITMIVPFPAGGQADLAARPVALALEKILGKPVIVDNRAGGGGGSVGNAAAARAEPDGHTLLMTLSSLAMLPEADRLFDRPVAYEVSQFAPIARVLADPTLLAVPASAPWKTLQDFVDDAKKRPGQIPYGSSGPYGTLHVAMEMFAASAGIKLLHVPFRGAGPALTALLSGTVQAMASAPGTLKQQVDDGKMRVLANWGAQRIASFPDLPTFRELGYKDVEFYIWAGLFAQSALPAPIMTRLREAMAQAVKSPGGDKNLRDRRQPGRLPGRAGIFKVRRRRQRPPDRGGEEDRQGRVGTACCSCSGTVAKDQPRHESWVFRRVDHPGSASRDAGSGMTGGVPIYRAPGALRLTSQTSTHSADVSSARRAGAMRTALWVEPAAGTTMSNAFSETSQ